MDIDLRNLLTQSMQLPTDLYSDQVIIITGAGQGIGYQTARAFGALGGTIILAELNETGVTAEENLRKEGVDAHFIQTDVSNVDSVSALHRNIVTKFGSIDILINNAICIRESSVVDMEVEEWDRIIAVNLRGTFLTCRAFLPIMLEKQKGTIINLVSTEAMPGLSAYIASKQGIVGFTQSLALELEGTGINAVPFAPGMVDTPGIRSVASTLAPRLGLSVEQFMHISLHAAYDGLMPSEHAAAAAVYLAAYLTEEFNGMVVNGYEILEKAGIIKQSMASGTPEEITDLLVTESQDEWVEKLIIMLNETEAELNQLPVFVRPIAKRGFKQKTSNNLSDWQNLLVRIKNGNPIPGDFRTQLENLKNYYKDVPAETSRFTRDKAVLDQVLKLTDERIALINKIQARLV